MKVTAVLYPPFRPKDGRGQLEVELPDTAALEDLLAVLSRLVDGFADKFSKDKNNNILWGQLVPIMDDKVIGYRDSLRNGCVIKIFAALDGG